jgi:hypothetical protein
MIGRVNKCRRPKGWCSEWALVVLAILTISHTQKVTACPILPKVIFPEFVGSIFPTMNSNL